MRLKSDIFEQRSVLAGLLEKQKGNVQGIARVLRDQESNYIFLVPLQGKNDGLSF